MGKRESNFLFTVVGLVIQIVIKLFFRTKLIVFEVKTGILCNNIIITMFYLFSFMLSEVHS